MPFALSWQMADALMSFGVMSRHDGGSCSLPLGVLV